MVKRLTLALLSGVLISLVLFWLMQEMIHQQQPVKNHKSLYLTEFVKLKKIEEKIKTERKQLPKELPPPLPPPVLQSKPVEKKSMPDMAIPELAASEPELITSTDVQLAEKPKLIVVPKPTIRKKAVIKKQPKPKVKRKKRLKPKKRVQKQAKRKSRQTKKKTRDQIDLDALKSLAREMQAERKKARHKRVTKKPKKKNKVVKKPIKKRVKKPVKRASKPKMSNRVNSNVHATYRREPKYPRRALSRRQQGWVKVQFIITAGGRVRSPFVVASKPSGIFNKAALRAIRSWRFKAKKVNGQAVAQKAVQTIQFRLR